MKVGSFCELCEAPDWDSEPDLRRYIAETEEYLILEERHVVGDVIVLELRQPPPFGQTATLRLPYRTRSDYVHMKGTSSLETGRGWLIKFSPPPSGMTAWRVANFRPGPEQFEIPLGRTIWGIPMRAQFNPHPSWELKSGIERCQRHAWAFRAGREAYDINAFAERMPCTCGPGCDLCEIGLKFAEDRHRRGSDGTNFWTDLMATAARWDDMMRERARA